MNSGELNFGDVALVANSKLSWEQWSVKEWATDSEEEKCVSAFVGPIYLTSVILIILSNIVTVIAAHKTEPEFKSCLGLFL